MDKARLREKIESLIENKGRYYMALGSDYSADQNYKQITDHVMAAFAEVVKEAKPDNPLHEDDTFPNNAGFIVGVDRYKLKLLKLIGEGK